MSRILAFLAGLALAALLAAHVPAPRHLGLRNPAAPPEAEQFAFLVGEWRCAVRRLQADGTRVAGPEARWTGYWILDGWAIQDDWVAPGPDGAPFRATTIRSFDPAAGRWTVRRLPQGALRWTDASAERVGDTLVLTGAPAVDPEGRSCLERATFYDIASDSFRWRQDRSYDAGATWIRGVVEVEARRVR
jgi:hypothetical protein